MAKFNIKGTVMHMPGPWGLKKPCKKAQIKIWDVDTAQLGSGTDDLIFDKKTTSSGKFSGKTKKEWHDKIPNPLYNSVLNPGAPEEVPNPADVLIMRASIQQGSHKIHINPFINDAPIPLIVPWAPPDYTPTVPLKKYIMASINGIPLTADDNPTDIWVRVRDLIESNEEEISIRLYGQPADLLKPLVGLDIDELRKFLFDLVPGLASVADPKFLKVNPIPESVLMTIIICATIVFTAYGLGAPLVHGASFIMFSVGMSLMMAVALGYANVRIATCSDLAIGTDLGDGTSGLNLELPVSFGNCVDFNIGKGKNGKDVLDILDFIGKRLDSPTKTAAARYFKRGR